MATCLMSNCKINCPSKTIIYIRGNFFARRNGLVCSECAWKLVLDCASSLESGPILIYCNEIYPMIIDYSQDKMTQLNAVCKMYIKIFAFLALLLCLVIQHCKNLTFSLIYCYCYTILPLQGKSYLALQYCTAGKKNLDRCCCNLLLLNLLRIVYSKILCRFLQSRCFILRSSHCC